jgi:hypothetical protein
MIPFVASLFLSTANILPSLPIAPTPIVVTEDVYWSGVIAQSTFTGSDGSTSFTDQSRFALTMTSNGGAAILSNKLELDGVNDYVMIATSNEEAVPATAFSLEIFKAAFDVKNETQVIASLNNGASGGRSWRFFISSANALTLEAWNGSVWISVAQYNWPYVLGEEYDLAVCWDGTIARLYINGAMAASGSISSFSTSSTSIRIGAEGNGSGSQTNFMNGRIAAIRFTRGVSRGTDITYTRHALPLTTTQAATTDALWPSVVMYVYGQGSDGNTKFQDKSPVDRTMTAVGTAQNDNDISVNGTPSILLGADGTYVIGQYLPDLNITATTPDFCMEAYVRCTDLAANNQIFGRRRDSGQFIFDIDNGNIRFLSYNGTTGTTRVSAASDMVVNTVYHACVQRSGTTYYLYVDGILKGSATSGSGTISTNSTGILIGDSETGQATRYWRGSVNHCRITIGATRYTLSGFTPPTVPYPTI